MVTKPAIIAGVARLLSDAKPAEDAIQHIVGVDSADDFSLCPWTRVISVAAGLRMVRLGRGTVQIQSIAGRTLILSPTAITQDAIDFRNRQWQGP